MFELSERNGKILDVVWAIATLALGIHAIVGATVLFEAELILYFLVHVLAAILYIIRRPPLLRSPSFVSYAVACLSTTYIFAFRFDQTSTEFAFEAGRYFILGGFVICILSLLSLGRSFGVLPIYRGIQTRLMYRIVRHPIYMSYVVMDVGLLMSYPSDWNAAVYIVGLVLFVVRINFEERLLAAIPEYRQYESNVRFRLIPLLY